jgi:hypothetical protein
MEILACHVFLTPDTRKQKSYQLKNGEGVKQCFPLAQRVTPLSTKIIDLVGWVIKFLMVNNVTHLLWHEMEILLVAYPSVVFVLFFKALVKWISYIYF